MLLAAGSECASAWQSVQAPSSPLLSPQSCLQGLSVEVLTEVITTVAQAQQIAGDINVPEGAR